MDSLINALIEDRSATARVEQHGILKHHVRESAFAEARSTLAKYGLPGSLPGLHDAGISISRSVLGGSHSVAIYPPIDSLEPISPTKVTEALTFGRHINLYLHIPFCETRCSFCHYAVQTYSGKSKSRNEAREHVVRYLSSLKREIAKWSLHARNSIVDSVYIGGGTPLVLETDELLDIVSELRAAFDLHPQAEMCIEGSPLTITAADGADKLQAVKEAGFTRLSFGVQSFDDEVLRFAARGYRRDVPIRAAEIVGDIFDNWNIDLIQGLYRGSPNEVWGNLAMVAKLKPPHITWYHGRFANRPQGDWLQSESRHGGFEEEYDTLLGRQLIWQELGKLGYCRMDGNRFARDVRNADSFKPVRTSLASDMIGIGPSAYSRVGGRSGAGLSGYVFRNITDIDRYLEINASSNLPIATAREIDCNESLAASYATGLRNGRIETDALASLRQQLPESSAYYDGIVKHYQTLRLLMQYVNDCGDLELTLTEMGRLYEDEVLSKFFSENVQFFLKTRSFE